MEAKIQNVLKSKVNLEPNKLPDKFILYCSKILGDTNLGLMGYEITDNFLHFSIIYDTEIPFLYYPFPSNIPNKRTALLENLKYFNPNQQFVIINELCDLPRVKDQIKVKQLKRILNTRYSFLKQENSNFSFINELLDDTKKLLINYPKSLKLFNECLSKLNTGLHQRNQLDDLRLSLELLLKEILKNNKSLEKQKSELGDFFKQKDVSSELRNMCIMLIDNFSNYQNNHIKHDDDVNENDFELILELFCIIIKYMIKTNELSYSN